MADILPIPLAGKGGRGKRPPELPRYFTTQEIVRLRDAVREHGTARDCAMLAVWYRYGLRISEVAALLKRDLDLRGRTLIVRRSKGGGECRYPLFEDCAPPLRAWLREHPGGPFLFAGQQRTNQRGLGLTAIANSFRAWCCWAGLDGRTPHSLRHSAAVHAIAAGTSLELVADLLGHRNLRSTLVYARVSSEAREALIRRLQDDPATVRMD